MGDKIANLIKFSVVCVLTVWNLTAIYAVFAPLSGNPFCIVDQRGTSVMDFVVIYDTGAIALSPDRIRPYDAEVQLKFANLAVAPCHIDRTLLILYPPFAFPLLSFLGLMPIKVAYTVWTSLWTIGALIVVYLLSRQCHQYSPTDRVILTMAALASQPGVICTKQGQTGWLLLTGFCLFALAWEKKRDIIAGLSITLVTLKPQYALFMLIPAIAHKRWKIILTTVAAELVLLAVAGLWIGWDNVVNYPVSLMKAQTGAVFAGIEPKSMVNVRGLASNLLPEPISLYITIAAYGCGLLLLLYIWRQNARHNKPDWRWAMGITAVLASLVSPHLHYHDLVLITLAAVLTLPTISLIGIGKVPPSLSIWSFLLLCYPIISWLCFGFKGSTELPILAIINTIIALAGIAHICRGQTTDVQSTSQPPV